MEYVCSTWAQAGAKLHRRREKSHTERERATTPHTHSFLAAVARPSFSVCLPATITSTPSRSHYHSLTRPVPASQQHVRATTHCPARAPAAAAPRHEEPVVPWPLGRRRPAAAAAAATAWIPWQHAPMPGPWHRQPAAAVPAPLQLAPALSHLPLPPLPLVGEARMQRQQTAWHRPQAHWPLRLPCGQGASSSARPCVLRAPAPSVAPRRGRALRCPAPRLHCRGSAVRWAGSQAHSVQVRWGEARRGGEVAGREGLKLRARFSSVGTRCSGAPQ